MPVYSIQVPSGQTLDIQADTPDAAMAGAQQWHAQQQPSGVLDNLPEGGAEAIGGVGKTIEAFTGKGPVGTALQNAGKSMAPANYVPANLIDDSGVHPSNVLPWLARRAPSALAALGAAAVAPEALGTAGAISAAAGAGTLMSAGNEAQSAATNRTGNQNETPSTGDLIRGGATSAAENLVGALPVTRLLPGAGTLAQTGAAGVIGALRKLAGTAALEGTAGAGANTVGQVGQSVGTPGGIKIDPTQVADAAAGNAITGGALAALPAARASLNAAKYSAITPDLQPAATQFANRMQQAADGANLNAGVIGGGAALRTGAEAFNKASAAVNNELSDAVSDLRSRIQLPTGANNVLDAAMSGLQPSARDYATLSQAVQGDPQADNVMNLVRQAHVADIVQNTGTLTDKKFVGGLSSIPTALNAHSAGKSALAAMGGAALEGGVGHVMAYSPTVLTALAGGAVAARLADRLTGARAPAGRFVSNFADGTTPVRLPQPAPQVSQAPSVSPTSPTGPKVPLAPSPWGSGPATPPSGPPVAGGSMIPPAVQAQMAARATLQKLSAANAPPVVAPAATVNPLALPRNITGPAASIMRGAAMAAKLKADALGQSAATSEVNASPFIQQKIGNAANVPTPAAAKYMSSAVRGANVLAKLQSDPEATAANKAAAKAQLNAATAAAKAATIPAKPAVNEPLQITGVTKSDGNVGVKTSEDEYVVPRSPYANLVPSAAAQQFLADAQNGGTAVTYRQGFVNATVRKITDIRNRAAAVAKEVQGVNPNATAAQFANEIAAQFEGVSNQKDAINHREWLKRQMPQAAAALDRHFSDEAIKGTPNKAGMWKRVGR